MIIRQASKPEYTSIARSTLQDENLSLEAIGLLAYFLSLPDDWQVRSTHIEKRFGIGTHKRRRIFKELEAAGYIEYIKLKNEKTGLMQGTECIVHEAPKGAENRETKNQSLGKPHPIQKSKDDTKETEKDILPKDKKTEPPTESNGKQPEDGKGKKESTPRSEFNAMKDAILAAFGWKAEDVVSWGIINSAASKLCKSGYTPDEVPGIYEVVEKKNFETFTPMVLVTYAPEYRAKQRRIEEMEQRQSESEQLPPPEMWT